jgi:hypothetical protein
MTQKQSVTRQVRYARWAFGAVGAVLVVFLLYFVFTHGQWFDEMKTSEKVKFWSDFGVSFGTIALALVTGASVFETQDVLQSEDRRFRQSRMPMVRMNEAYVTRRADNVDGALPMTTSFILIEPSDYILNLMNDGDGPALNVRITMTLTVYKEIRAGEGAGTTEDDKFHKSSELLSSFLSPGSAREVRFKDVYTDMYRRPLNHQYGAILITYDDSFGDSYSTMYPNFDSEPWAFTLTRPTI